MRRAEYQLLARALEERQHAKERRELRSIIRGFVRDATRVAESSYRTWTGTEFVWNDAVWRDNDPKTFALVRRARKLGIT